MAELTPPPFQYEVELQQWLAHNAEALEAGLWIVGYEFPLGGNKVDLLGVDQEGWLVVIEVKRANATREAVGQVLDYVSTLDKMTPSAIVDAIETAPPQSAFVPVLNFEQRYAERFNGADLSTLTPARIILASTSASPATARILAYLKEHDVNAKNVLLEGYTENGKRRYRRRQSMPAVVVSEDESELDGGRLAASKPRHGTAGRRKIDEVHDGVEDYARAECPGAKLFTEVHGAIVSALYEGTEERRALTGKSFGITVKMRATESDPQKTEADYVTVRFYPLEKDHVRLYIFDAARRRAVDASDRLLTLPELEPYESNKPPGTIIWFNHQTWAANSHLFEQLLRDAKAAWEIEVDAGHR